MHVPFTADNRDRALEALFEGAIDLAPDAREVYVREHCADPSLRAEVLELLAISDRDPSFLTRPLAAGETTWQRLFRELPAAPPESVGPFRLLRQIGVGGMGRVYLAEQRHPRLEVAVKLLFGCVSGPTAADAAQRFEREIAALARLQHPGLVQILDAGVDDAGRAWFAMHFVPGRPLLEAAAELHLGLRARLLLLADVCDAVACAHGQGVVHCDLKPGNVLVDAAGQPVVLDFGIAKLRLADAPAAPASRRPHIVGTPAYMSPEQAEGDRHALDARTDVYALGVMLYELLTDRLPYVTRGLAPAEALEVVRTAEPAPLGVLSAAADAQAPVDARELQLIVDVALAKERGARYASVAALAGDLRRCAEGRPVLARRPSPWKRARLLARRRPGACAAVLAAAVALLGGLGIAWVQRDLALANEAAAAAELAERTRLVDRRALNELRAISDALWPAWPERLAELEAAAARARELLARAPAHRQRLAALTAAEPADAAAWERSLLADLVQALERAASADLRVGLLVSVERRLEYARGVEQATLVAPAAAWAHAAEEVARDPRFGGLRLQPQRGLVPLGPDPVSGLQEFALWFWTGAVPRRDPASGALQLDEGSGVVLVLVPGGCTLVGSQASDPQRARYVPTARRNEGPLVHVELEPFLVMKDEFTTGQYLRFTGEHPGRAPHFKEGFITAPLLLPVTELSWEEAARCVQRLGMELITEAQWEHVARAGTDTAWWTGSDQALLERAANVSDRAGLPPENWPLGPEGRVFDDGVRFLAQIDQGLANPFGLRHVHGNAWEFCADIYRTSLEGTFRAADGLHLVQPDPGERERRVLRGGSHEERLDASRSSFRSDVPTTQQTQANQRAVWALSLRSADD